MSPLKVHYMVQQCGSNEDFQSNAPADKSINVRANNSSADLVKKLNFSFFLKSWITFIQELIF